MKKTTLRTIIGACLIISLIVLGTLFLKMAKENSKCEGNPFVYGAQKTAEQGLEIMCSCTSLNPKFSGFYFDKDGWSIQRDFSLNP